MTCTDCVLHEKCETVCLPGRGPRKAKAMIIYGNPTKEDDHFGTVLRSHSGKEVRTLCEEAGLNWRRLYKTYAVKCFTGDPGKKPSASQIRECKKHLEADIERVDPSIVLLIGPDALKTALGVTGLKNYKGTPVEHEGRTYVTTNHPNYILRFPDQRNSMLQDYRTFARCIEDGGAPKHPGFEYTLCLADKQRWAMVKDIKRSKIIAADTETNGLDAYAPGAQINLLQVTTKKHTWLLPLAHKDSPLAGNHKLQKKWVKRVADAIKDCKRRIFHGAKFDYGWIKSVYDVEFKPTDDTMIMHYLLDENSPHGLNINATQIFDVPNWEVPTEVKTGKAGTLKDNLAPYAGLDSFYTRKLFFIWQKALKAQRAQYRIYRTLYIPMIFEYQEIEERGLELNKTKQKEALKALNKDLAKLTKKLVRIAGKDINWNSNQQLAEVLYDHLEIPTDSRTVAEDHLIYLKHKIISPLIEWRKTRKLISFVEGKGWTTGADGRVHPSFNLIGAVTGRPSCENPNLQQVPRDSRVRSLFGEWQEECIHVEVDYSQIELRVIAELACDYVMQEIYENGGDVHTHIVQTILGIMEPTKEERTRGKAINFGFMFGMWWYSFIAYAKKQYGVDFTDSEAKAAYDGYFQQFPNIRPYHERQIEYAHRHGYVQTLTGRKRRLPRLLDVPIIRNGKRPGWQGHLERIAINAPVQGFDAELLSMAVVTLGPILQKKFGSSCMTLTVHDSIHFRFENRQQWIEAAPIIARTMINPPLFKKLGVIFDMPIEVEATVGPAWGEGKEYTGAQMIAGDLN